MNDLTAQLREEVGHILSIVQELTGLPSNWNGELELVPDAGFRGRKPFACGIVIEAALAHRDIRWSTLIHEALHAVSVGYAPTDYRMFRGWEEGVVERLQRLFRPIVLARLSIGVEETLFPPIDVGHQYNAYIAALEQLRSLLSVTTETFYLDLLRSPIKERPGHVFGMGNSLPGQARIRFITSYSTANAVLRGSL